MNNIQIHDGRIDWVDYAKGFCIIFVVMMHSTLGVEAAAGHEGWLHPVVAFALPFRMPDFFMISGLFLANVIDRPWRQYADRKVVHFAYFYLLWMTVQFAFKAPGIIHEQGVIDVARLYVLSLVDPFGTLWFIYLLPVFFVFIKLTRRVPFPVIWLFGAALEIAHINTGWMVPDEFAARFVYCYTGYIFAKSIFALTARAQAQPLLGLAGLIVWGLLNGTMVHLGYEILPFVSLGLGLAGACAVVTVASLMAKSRSVQAVALLRAQFDRHLSRLLPPDGGNPCGTAQERPDRGCRYHFGDRHRSGCPRLALHILGPSRNSGTLSVRAALAVLARATEAHRAAARRIIPQPAFWRID